MEASNLTFCNKNTTFIALFQMTYGHRIKDSFKKCNEEMVKEMELT